MAGTGNPVVVGSYQSVCSSPPPTVRHYDVAVCLDPRPYVFEQTVFCWRLTFPLFVCCGNASLTAKECGISRNVLLHKAMRRSICKHIVYI